MSNTLEINLKENVEGLDEALRMVMHYIGETILWKHRANEISKAILDDEPISDIMLLAKKVQAQLKESVK